MITWQSLFLCCADSALVVQSLHSSLSGLGYTLYDPFDLTPGQAYPLSIRLFVAPLQSGWVRVIGAPDRQQLPELSRLGLCLSLALAGTAAEVEVYGDGQQVEPELGLTPHLRAGVSVEILRRALSPNRSTLPVVREDDAVPLDVLPDYVRAMAKGVNPKHVQKMFSRFSKQFLGENQREAARELISGSAPDWNSPGGRQLHTLVGCLTLPGHWRKPDFVTLRDAYQLHQRKRRLPNATLYPGDAQAMATVPDALDYVPIYAGKMN